MKQPPRRILGRPPGRWIWDLGTAAGVVTAWTTQHVWWVPAGWAGGLAVVLILASARACRPLPGTTRLDCDR